MGLRRREAVRDEEKGTAGQVLYIRKLGDDQASFDAGDQHRNDDRKHTIVVIPINETTSSGHVGTTRKSRDTLTWKLDVPSDVTIERLLAMEGSYSVSELGKNCDLLKRTFAKNNPA